MTAAARIRPGGFTLIELLAAMLILSALALMSYRGLGAVLDAREHVAQETEKWRRVSAFFERFERDIRMAAPRGARSASGHLPAWRGIAGASMEPLVEFTRFASIDGMDSARRLAYRLNERQEIELWLWPGPDVAPGAPPARYAVLRGVTAFELQYLDGRLAWVNVWPVSTVDPPIPRAVRLRVLLASGEELVRVFALDA